MILADFWQQIAAGAAFWLASCWACYEGGRAQERAHWRHLLERRRENGEAGR